MPLSQFREEGIMGLRRILSVIGIGMSFNSAAVATLSGLDLSASSTMKNQNHNYGRKNDIHRMPNADAQYYKKHQHEIR
jgi:hypothetical protein